MAAAVPGKRPREKRYFFSFIFSGCIDLILTWLRGGMKESREYMSALLETFIMDGASVLKP